MESVNLTAQIPENSHLISGGLNLQDQTVGIGSTISNSFVCSVPEAADSLDLVFLIDSSGSMTEELDEVKSEVLDLVDSLSSLVDTLRIGFIMFGGTLFSENPYDNPRNALGFTRDSTTISDFIAQFSARGSWRPGAMQFSTYKFSWESTANLAILITDEPCNSGYYIGDGGLDRLLFWG